MILGLIIGIILVIIGKKASVNKYVKIIGILIIIVCLCIVIPDFIKGFKDGFNGVK
ncbi:MAG: hypothetical protein PHX70_08860 [Clostridium sp.]|nr:hypothetical protein [Clostridium sp.]